MSGGDPDENRYARQAQIDWWDQERLSNARVLVAGAGALGNEVIKLLAQVGVGEIVIVDFDVIEVSNLNRGVLFRDSDIGCPKSAVAARRAREINPEIWVTALQADLEYEVGLGVYRSMDLVIGCLDSVNARLALNRACRRAGVPWINGGIEATLGEVALFDGHDGPCFECAMSEAMWERRNERYSCAGMRGERAEEPAPTTAVTASILAGLMVNEAIFSLFDDGQKAGLAYGEKLYLTLRPYSLNVLKMPQSADCLAHERCEPVAIYGGTAARATPADLIDWTGDSGAVVELGFDLLTEMRCVVCGATEPVMQPAERSSLTLIKCPACGAEEGRQPQTISWIDADSPFATMPFAVLRVPEYAALTIRGAAHQTYVQLTGEYQSGDIN